MSSTGGRGTGGEEERVGESPLLVHTGFSSKGETFQREKSCREPCGAGGGVGREQVLHCPKEEVFQGGGEKSVALSGKGGNKKRRPHCVTPGGRGGG